MAILQRNSLKDALFSYSVLLRKRMEELLPKGFKDSRLIEAMRYSVLSDGKRIRPFLLMTSANMLGVDAKNSINAAVAIEFIHVYSLIHDDLPAMDDDDIRRGIATCHKKFDEATAILAGDALLTFAFEILSDVQYFRDAATCCQLTKILTKAAGFRGMVGGQMMDLENANSEISNEKLAKLHRLKTGELFIAAAKMGAVLGQANAEQEKALSYFAHDLGLAFQIKDDILDHLGTNVGKIEIDEHIHKKPQENASIVDVIGMQNSQQRLELLKEQAINHLNIFGSKAELLVELAQFVTVRQN